MFEHLYYKTTKPQLGKMLMPLIKRYWWGHLTAIGWTSYMIYWAIKDKVPRVYYQYPKLAKNIGQKANPRPKTIWLRNSTD